MVIVIAIIVGVMGSANYQEVTSVRDQRNLQLALDDRKRLFNVRSEHNNCFEKSINAFS